MRITREIERQGDWLFRRRSYLPLLFVPLLATAIYDYRPPLGNLRLHSAWALVCFSLSCLGVAVRCHVAGHVPVGTSGRNTRVQIAKQLNTTGAYAVVRHPLYLANFLIGLGIVLTPCSAWLALTYFLLFWVYYERIMASEERFLESRFADRFVAWASRTRAFLPAFRNWQPPVLPFSTKTVLKKEYMAVLLTVTFHSLIHCAKQSSIRVDSPPSATWGIAAAATVCLCLGLRALKKHTQLLAVRGR